MTNTGLDGVRVETLDVKTTGEEDKGLEDEIGKSVGEARIEV